VTAPGAAVAGPRHGDGCERLPATAGAEPSIDRGPGGLVIPPGGAEAVPRRSHGGGRGTTARQSPTPVATGGTGGTSRRAGLSSGLVFTLAGGVCSWRSCCRDRNEVTLRFLFWSFTWPLRRPPGSCGEPNRPRRVASGTGGSATVEESDHARRPLGET